MIRRSIAVLSVVLALAGIAVLPADAAHRPAPPGRTSWSSARSGVAGVEAHGQFTRRGTRVHVFGTLTDTRPDRYVARLDVRVLGGCGLRVFRDQYGPGSGVRVDVTSARSVHVDIREVAEAGDRVVPGAWVRLF